MVDRVIRTNSEWRSRLSDMQYHVTREGGTERAFSGRYHDHQSGGRYTCVCCGALLFDSAHKYDSGSGWPSFWKRAGGAPVGHLLNDRFGLSRTQVVCTRCNAHLGHLFEDGPQPTGLRYCINSNALAEQS